MKLIVEDFKPAPLSVEYKKAKRSSLAISVYPDLSVEAISPLESSENEVIEKILKRRRWILKQQKYFRGLQAKEQPTLTTTGAELYYLGKQYRLRIYSCDQKKQASLNGRFLNVPVEDSQDVDTVKQRLSQWYRDRAKAYLTKSFNESLVKYAHLDLPPSKLRLSLMKTRWGSCTASATITLNPLLVLFPSSLIKYVIVHEICHLKHPDHSKAFYSLLTKTLPDWKKRKAALDQFGAKLKSLPSPFH